MKRTAWPSICSAAAASCEIGLTTPAPHPRTSLSDSRPMRIVGRKSGAHSSRLTPIECPLTFQLGQQLLARRVQRRKHVQAFSYSQGFERLVKRQQPRSTSELGRGEQGQIERAQRLLVAIAGYQFEGVSAEDNPSSSGRDKTGRSSPAAVAPLLRLGLATDPGEHVTRLEIDEV